ncbi:hypothetical protein [Limimaricola cinnabarinus]|uniref:hypothetical protein n=1 Tax=Limimaricola cinnabarinus TaxID=1125964 RepID=UPI00248F6E3A|nr:hypothetical protein [Limimaricola cinnabarinus]
MTLCDLLLALGEEQGANAVAELIGLFDAPLPTQSVVMATLADVALFLNKLSFGELDALAISGCAPLNVYGAVRWFRARVADLTVRFTAI